MAPEQTKVLLTGGTGYIGGSVLSTLLTSRDEFIQKCQYSVMVRGAEKADYFEKKGIKPILFNDLEDVDILKQAASEHDVVINTATGFATNTARALIQGLGQRQKQTGKKTIFLHTSGTSNLGDRPISGTYIEERFKEGRPFSDTEDIDAHERYRESLEKYPQRTTDIVVVDTGLAEGVPTYIMMPPTIWGKGTGYFNKRSMQVPAMIRGALKNRQAVVVGEGAGKMDHVHVQDLAILYELLLQELLRGNSKLPSGKQGIYFAESGKHTWMEVAKGIGKAGKEMGLLDTDEVKRVSLQEASELFTTATMAPEHAELGYALNTLTQTTRAKALGWEPSRTRDEFLSQFHDEFEAQSG